MLLNNQQITEEIKREIKLCIERNENENTTSQNMWDTVRTGHGTTDWFQIGKGLCQGCILSPCLFN